MGWDELSTKSGEVVVAKLDCNDEAHTVICEERFNVEGFPTLKFFTPTGSPLGTDYNGGRDLAALEKFITGDLLEPTCDAAHLDLCSEEDRADLKAMLSTSDAALQELQATYKKAVGDSNKKLNALLEELQKQFEEAEAADKAIKEKFSPKMAQVAGVLRARKSSKAKNEL